MKLLRKTLTYLLALVCACLISSAIAQGQNRAGTQPCTPISPLAYEDGVPTVQLEMLLKEPQCYDGKFIRTYGFYRYGFEISELYCLDCKSSGLIWFDSESYFAAYKRCTSKENQKRLDSENGRTVGVAVLGVVRTGGGFGHLNGSQHQFSVICIDEVKVFANDYAIPQYLSAKTLREMRDWYKQASEKY